MSFCALKAFSKQPLQPPQQLVKLRSRLHEQHSQPPRLQVCIF